MDLDRGTLARIDRKLLAGLGQDESFQMVRVPVTPAQWSTWRRYCDASGVSMGRAITSLIEHELLGVFGESTSDEVPILAGRTEERLATREAQVNERDTAVKAAEEGLRSLDGGVALVDLRLTCRQPFFGSPRKYWNLIAGGLAKHTQQLVFDEGCDGST